MDPDLYALVVAAEKATRAAYEACFQTYADAGLSCGADGPAARRRAQRRRGGFLTRWSLGRAQNVLMTLVTKYKSEEA